VSGKIPEHVGFALANLQGADQFRQNVFRWRILATGFQPVNVGVIYLRELRQLAEGQAPFFTQTLKQKP